MPRVTFIQPDGAERTVEIDEGQSVMSGAVNCGIPGIAADCGGACVCATCHVFVAREWIGRLVAPEQIEADMIECAIDPDVSSRLACQIKMTAQLDGLRLRIPNSQH